MTQVTEQDPQPVVSRRAWMVLGATSLTNFVVGLDLSITNVAVRDIGREFASASTADVSWVLTFYMVMLAGMMIPAGRWADRFGRLRVLNFGIAAFAVGAAIAALSPSLPVLVAMRGLQGIGAGFMIPASLGLAVAAFPIERRGTAVAIWSSTLALSSVAGPIVGGLVIQIGSWRWAYALVVPISLIALFWGLRVLAESTRDLNARRPDLIGATLLGGGTAVLALAIVQGQEWGWASPLVLGLLIAAVVAVAAVSYRIARHSDPIVPRVLFTVSSFRVGSISLFLFGLGFVAMVLTMVLFLTDVAGYSTFRAGLGVSMLPVAATISANFSGRLADRFGFRNVAVPGILLFTAGAAWLFFRAGSNPNYVVDVLPGLVLAGCGIGAGPPVLAGAGVSQVDPEHFSVAGAVTQASRQVASAMGIALLVAIIGSTGNEEIGIDAFRRAFIFLGTVSALSSLVATRLPRPAARRATMSN